MGILLESSKESKLSILLRRVDSSDRRSPWRFGEVEASVTTRWVDKQLQRLDLWVNDCGLGWRCTRSRQREIKILYFLERLQQRVVKAGSEVITMNSNHETLNMERDFWYTSGTCCGCEGWSKPPPALVEVDADKDDDNTMFSGQIWPESQNPNTFYTKLKSKIVKLKQNSVKRNCFIHLKFSRETNKFVFVILLI